MLRTSLGSSNVSYRSDGGQTVTQRYYPWGTVRPGPGNALPTGYTFTGQLDSGVGLMYYGARFYDGALGRFAQPDTIVPEPGNPQALNRYSYALNRPTVLVDSTGHVAHPNCQGSGAAIADCGVDGWYGYEDYAVRKQLREIGQREGDKVARALLDVVSALFEPADYAATIGACLSGDCSVLALAAMALPVVPGVVGRNAGEAVDIVKRLDAGSDALPARIYRGGDPSPSNLRPRAGEEGLSFRNSLSNPYPLPDNQRPVFEPGKPFFSIDASGLPPGSIIPDNVPPGHVTVIDVAWEILKSLVVDRGKFPK
jgi:RHS repeat-associated protein